MLDKETLNTIANQLSKYQPDQIIINNKQTINNPDITIMIKKENKEFVVENGIEEIKSEITLTPIEKFITNSKKRNTVLIDLYSSGTTIYST